MFRNTCALIEHNYRGHYWICGGYVFRTLAKCLYKSVAPAPDIDIMTEKPADISSMLPDWSIIHRNHYGNLKLGHQSGMSVDHWDLPNFFWIVHSKLKPLLRNYLAGVPLTVQSIVYDPRRKQIIGATGIRALLTKTVATNNQWRMQERAERYGVPARTYIKEKASSLGFTPIYD